MPQQAQKSVSTFLIINHVKFFLAQKGHLSNTICLDNSFLKYDWTLSCSLKHIAFEINHHQHWLQKLKRPLAVQLRSSCEKLWELFLCRQLIPAMMKIKGRAKNIDNDVDTDWSWCCGCFQKWENTIHQHHSQHTLSQSFFFYLLSINFLNEYILTSEDSARALRTYKKKCTRGN